MTENTRSVLRAEAGSLLLAGILIALYVVSLILLDSARLPSFVLVGRGLLPAAGVAAFALAQLRATRRLDELQRRIHLESLAFGYPFAIVAVLAIRFLQAEGFLQGWGLAEVWPLLPLPYFVGLALAWRRYR